MSDDEIRIAIAEARGLEQCQMIDGIPSGIKPPLRDWMPVPDWPADLNACHEFEETLTDEDQSDYTDALALVLRANWNSNNGYDHWMIAHATARQRCEAFLKVKGLWREPAAKGA
jgi:hypothetical protein